MEIEKTLTVSAPRERVWALLLDPQVMGGAVPGMKSIAVISPTEYVAVMHQKISFISAKFKLRTRIVEQRAPEYLRAEGTGEDTSVASSLKQQSEVFLTATPDGGTELRIKVNVDVLGRLGTFGLGVMKTKADRMWEEFGANLAARIEIGGAPAMASVVAAAPPASTAAAPTPIAPVAAPAIHAVDASARGGWWTRLFSSANGDAQRQDADTIHVEVRRGDTIVTVRWPAHRASECAGWLRDYLKQ